MRGGNFYDLLPALKVSEAGEKGAAIGVLAAGSTIDLEDLALKKVQRAALIAPTYNDLMLEASRCFVNSCILLTFSLSVLLRTSIEPLTHPRLSGNPADFSASWLVRTLASSFSLSPAPSPYRG